MCVHAYYSLNILFRYKILKECTVGTNNNDVNILFSNYYHCIWEVIDYELGDRCSIPGRSRNVPVFHRVQPVLGFTQTPIKLVAVAGA
jgi:hypothetical protein